MFELGLEDTVLRARDGAWTAREIAQQPEMLRATHALLRDQADTLEAFLQPYRDDADARIILTGAGTSSFIGDCLAPFLDRQCVARVEAIATTDIVSAPRLFLDPGVRTLLVSFGRSGNSPESAAAIDLANAIVGDLAHLIITCNKDGALARNAGGRDHVILLPERTHDRGFAMTSSFSSMTYAALAALSGVAAMDARIEPIAEAVSAMLAESVPLARRLAAAPIDRVVYLGSHVFKGLAREAALKLMELTDGQVVATSDTPLGFRHGPKTIVTDATLLVLFVSNDPHTRRYDLDLLDEVRRDAKAAHIVALSAQPLEGGDCLMVPAMAGARDVDLLFPFIVFAQVFALHASLSHGLTPDSPNVSGTVNRVVQGVTIHPLVAA